MILAVNMAREIPEAMDVSLTSQNSHWNHVVNPIINNRENHHVYESYVYIYIVLYSIYHPQKVCLWHWASHITVILDHFGKFTRKLSCLGDVGHVIVIATPREITKKIELLVYVIFVYICYINLPDDRRLLVHFHVSQIMIVVDIPLYIPFIESWLRLLHVYCCQFPFVYNNHWLLQVLYCQSIIFINLPHHKSLPPQKKDSQKCWLW